MKKYDRPYEIEKNDLQENVNFGVISKYFAKCCLKTFKDDEHKEALKDDYRLEHAGSMCMYNLLKDKLNGRLK